MSDIKTFERNWTAQQSSPFAFLLLLNFWVVLEVDGMSAALSAGFTLPTSFSAIWLVLKVTKPRGTHAESPGVPLGMGGDPEPRKRATLRSTYIRLGPTRTSRAPCHHRAQRGLCGATMRAPLGGRTQPLHRDFMKLVVSLKNHHCLTVTELVVSLKNHRACCECRDRWEGAPASGFELDLRYLSTCKLTRRGRHWK